MRRVCIVAAVVAASVLGTVAPPAGAVGLLASPWDRAELEAIQADVGLGHHSWRLDPEQVARAWGVRLGFSPEHDQFNILPSKPGIPGPDGPTVDVQVLHGQEVHVMTLVQPLGPGPDKIWVVESVTRVPDATVLYASQGPLEDSWIGARPRVRFYVSGRFMGPDFDPNTQVGLVADLGERPTGGYSIGIRNIILRGRTVTVTVWVSNPKPGDMVVQALTRPLAYAVINKEDLPKGSVTFEIRRADGAECGESRTLVNDLGSYTVRPGDSFYRIASRFDMPLSKLLSYNEGVDPLNLQVGHEVMLEPVLAMSNLAIRRD
ncbi:MAG: protease complex subunit PrcB family protein [Firmicutes bacterium]|nr:protease complex subunit PrcB family protein [Bacillota bacterium]